MKLIEVVETIHEYMLKKIILFGRFITQKNIFILNVKSRHFVYNSVTFFVGISVE
jgi:hypothetical protein